MSESIENRVLLKNVRCIYPHVHKKHQYENNAPKFQTGFIFDKDNEKDAKWTKKINKVMKVILDAKGKKVARDNSCLRDGEDLESDSFNNFYRLSSASKERPYVVGRDGKKRILDEEECRLYSGCRVNAKVEFYYSSTHKRMCAEIKSIQFVGDDEPFGAGHMSDEEKIEGFDSFDDDDDDFDDEDL